MLVEYLHTQADKPLFNIKYLARAFTVYLRKALILKASTKVRDSKDQESIQIPHLSQDTQ